MLAPFSCNPKLHVDEVAIIIIISHCCDTLLLKGTQHGKTQVEGPFIQEVVYNTTSQDVVLRWKPKSNIIKYSIQISTCDDSLLMNTTVNSSCSVFQLSGVNFTKYGLLLVAVQSCVTDDVCGVDLPAGVSEKNIIALSMQVNH